MSWPTRGGFSQMVITSNGTGSKPAVGDVLTINVPTGFEAADYNFQINRGAGYVSLSTGSQTYTLQAGDIPAIGGDYPIIGRAILGNLISRAFDVTNPPAVPAAPTMGTATAGNAIINAPYTDGSNGGAAITSHDAQLFDAAGNLIATVTGVANPAVLNAANGVNNGIAQKVKVRAINSVGPGPYSTVFSNTVTPTATPVVPSFLGQVATGTQILDAKHASNTQSYTRSPHIARVDVTSLQIVIPNWYVTAQAEANGTGTATWTASIEYPVGVFTQAKFGGVASGVVTAGNNLISDAVAVAIPTGAKFWVRMYQITTGQIMFFQYYAGDGTAQAAYGTSVADMTMGGTAATVASTGAVMIIPCAIIANTTTPAVGVYGDSISVGRGDSDGVGRALQGHAGRAFGARYPTGHVGVSGDRIQTFLASNSKRMALAAYFSHIAINMGINDVSNARTAGQVQNDMNSMITLFGSKPVSVYTITPVSSSTDGWTTVVNQALVAGTPNAVRSAINIQRLSTLPLARNVFDPNPTVENNTAPEDSFWNIIGGANTNDGTHHNANSAGRIASATNVDLLVY